MLGYGLKPMLLSMRGRARPAPGKRCTNLEACHMQQCAHERSVNTRFTFNSGGAQKHRLVLQRRRWRWSRARRSREASRIDRARAPLNAERSFERGSSLNRGEMALGALSSKPRSPRPSHHRRFLPTARFSKLVTVVSIFETSQPRLGPQLAWLRGFVDLAAFPVRCAL